MIPVTRVDEPEGYHAQVRLRGEAWRAEHPEAKELRPYWIEFLPHLREGFGRRCGYAAMYVPDGTVDHFVSQRDRPDLAYEWDNLRFASSWMNASKKAREVLDPYEVGPGWFEVLLPSMALVARFERIPEARHALVRATLAALPLVHDERIVRQRSEWYRQFRRGAVSLEGLRDFAPLIAAAVDRWARERPGEPLP